MAEQPRPTQGDVFAWLDQRRRVLSPMHARMGVADDWFHADETPSPILRYINKRFPAGFDFDIYPFGWVVTNRAVNQVYTGKVPQITYELPAEDKEKHSEWGEHEREVQQWAQGVAHRIITKATENPAIDMLQQQLGTGLGVLSYARDYDWNTKPDHGRGTPEEEEAWDFYDRQRSERLPWRVESLHPTWVFFDTDNDPPQNYIIARQISRAAAAKQFPKLNLDPASESADTTVEYVEYADQRFYGCWVNNEPVTPGDHVQGIKENALLHTWTQLAWSGLGKKDKDASWERRGVGVIQRGIPVFRSLTFNKNWLKLLKLAYMPKLIGSGPSEEEAARVTENIDPTEPEVVNKPDNVTLSYLETPRIPAALLADLEDDEQKLEQLYGPGVLSGQDSYAGEPASKYAARREAASGPYRGPKQNAEQAWANMFADMLWDIAHESDLEDGHAVTWEEGEGEHKRTKSAHVKREHIHPGGKFSCDFTPTTPQDKAFDTEDAINKQTNQLISNETAMKKTEITDVVGEQIKIAWDVWRAGPTFMQFLDELILPRLRQRYGMMPPAPPPAPAMPMGGDPAAMNAQPVMAEMPLLPNVPQQPPPLLGSQQEAQQQAQSFFAPQTANGARY